MHLKQYELLWRVIMTSQQRRRAKKINKKNFIYIFKHKTATAKRRSGSRFPKKKSLVCRGREPRAVPVFPSALSSSQRRKTKTSRKKPGMVVTIYLLIFFIIISESLCLAVRESHFSSLFLFVYFLHKGASIAFLFLSWINSKHNMTTFVWKNSFHSLTWSF